MIGVGKKIEGRLPDYAAGLIKSKDADKLEWILKLQKNLVYHQYRYQKDTLLHIASENNNTEALELLIKYGADVSARTNGGHTVLDTAVWSNSVASLTCLLQHCPELIHEKRNDGWTPLHRAAHENKLDCAKVLIEKGANIEDVDNQGKMPWQLAHDDAMRELLVLKS